MMWLIATLLFVVKFVIISTLLVYARWHYGTLEKLGFPVVTPHFFLGSSPRGYKELSHLLDANRVQKYGSIFGAYEGRNPKIFVSDPDLVKKILVKDYDYFSDRLPWELLYHELPLGILDFQLGDTWRVLRANITKGLSIGRIKTMGQLSQCLIDDYILDLAISMKDRTTMDLRSITTPLSIELCCLLYLGIKFEDRKNPDNSFIKVMQSLFVDSVTKPPDFRQTIGYAFPFLGKYISPGPFSIPFFPDECLDEFVRLVSEVLENQRSKKHKGNDMITVLLESIERTESDEYKKLGITKTCIMSQIFELFLAMYEGLPTAVASFFYHVAKSPESMVKLVNEVEKLFETTKGCLTIEEIVKLPYLTACLTETFRIFPTFHRLDRVCVKDWEDTERGIKITKGIPVFICLWPMHHNPEYFPNPEQFQPERFLPEAAHNLHPYAFGVFGHGPKSCPGNKLITDILKMTIFEILTNFQVKPCPTYSMKQYPGFGPFIKTNPILVDLIPKSR